MPACAIKHCNNKSSINNKASGITYHLFPTDPVMYDQWLHVVRLLRGESCWKPTKYTMICSIHFKESDMFVNKGKGGAKRLHKNAVPMREFLSSTESVNKKIKIKTPDKTAGNETSPPDNLSGVDCMSVDSTCDIDTEQKVSTLDMEYNKLTTVDHYNISFNTEDIKIFRLDRWNSKVSGNVCRTCLAVDGKMFNIGHYKLKQYYQNLTGILFSQEDTLPKMMCWECVARLQNANSFREKALRSYDLLLKNIKSETTVSMTDVLSINRVENGLTSALAVAHMCDVSCGTHSDDVTTIEVKEEADIMWPETEVVDTEDQEQQDQGDQEDPLEDHKQQDQEDSVEYHEQQDQEDQENPLDTRLALHGWRLSSSSQTRELERPARAKNTTKTSARAAGRAARGAELDSSIFKVVAVPMERALAEAAQRATRPQYLAAQYRCNVCYKTFTTPTAEEEHALQHSDVMGLFECAVCRCRWRTRNGLVKHFTESHTRDHMCKLCPFTSRHRTAARAHERFHKGVKFQCSLCPKEFATQTAYLSHLRLNHVCRHPCALCGFTFLSHRGVEVHMRRNHKRHKDVELTGPYCAECDVRFATDDAHDRHLQLSVVHRPEDAQNSSQPLRNDYHNAEERKYRGKSKIKSEHTKTKRAEPKQCALICCEQHPCQLRVHATEHVAGRGKPCGAGAGRTGAGGHTDASRHLYACPLCPKRFTQRGNRARHIVTIHHGAERRFRCPACDKRFWESSGLRLHYDHVHLKKPWPQRTRPPRPRPAPATGQELLESTKKDAGAEI